jgi:thiol-disulfide isomerase/thioredoxin
VTPGKLVKLGKLVSFAARCRVLKMARTAALAAGAIGMLRAGAAAGTGASAGSRAGANEPIPTASLARALAAVKSEGRDGGGMVLLNVWATWCDPCRAELPELLRFYRENRSRGVRLVMVSADDPEQQADVRRVLREAVMAAGIGVELEPQVFIKAEDDTVFVDGLDQRWSGALPATFAFDAAGARKRSWLGPVTASELEAELGVKPGLTPRPAGTNSQAPGLGARSAEGAGGAGAGGRPARNRAVGSTPRAPRVPRAPAPSREVAPQTDK